jgi:hypothetical protein
MALRLRERMNRGFFELGRRLAWGIDDMFTRQSRLGNPAFFESALFPWIPALEARTPAIRRERRTSCSPTRRAGGCSACGRARS